MRKEQKMSKELEALERLKTAPTFMGGTIEYQACTKSETLLLQDYEIVKQALLELQSIKEANPSEALNGLESYINNIIFAKDLINQKQQLLTNITAIKQALERLESIDNAEPSEALKTLKVLDETISPLLEPVLAEYEDDLSDKITSNYFALEQALLKAREQEKEKLLFKNIHNTKVKTPLVSIFEGISKDERFKFTEHIYYHWEEMKEALEDKNNELEKENELLREIIKSFFDRGCPLHQYTDKQGILQIEIDNECSTMHLGKFKDVDLDKKLKEVLE